MTPHKLEALVPSLRLRPDGPLHFALARNAGQVSWDSGVFVTSRAQGLRA